MTVEDHIALILQHVQDAQREARRLFITMPAGDARYLFALDLDSHLNMARASIDKIDWSEPKPEQWRLEARSAMGRVMVSWPMSVETEAAARKAAQAYCDGLGRLANTPVCVLHEVGQRPSPGGAWTAWTQDDWKATLVPVSGNVMVDVRFRDGTSHRHNPASYWSWQHTKTGIDIIAWRLAK